MKASLDHINMTVKNLKESVYWYGKYFGFNLVEEGVSTSGIYAVLQSGESMLCLHEMQRSVALDDSAVADRYHRIYHFALRIEDRKAWQRLFATEDFVITYESPTHYPHSMSWYIADPNGHQIEVVSWNENKVSFA